MVVIFDYETACKIWSTMQVLQLRYNSVYIIFGNCIYIFFAVHVKCIFLNPEINIFIKIHLCGRILSIELIFEYCA